jgi:AAA+ ATPase superfamily predicted ATPase
MKELNPFITKGYVSKDLFCNRETELKILENNFNNNIDTTLISPRRMGKTGLIYRFFDLLNNKNGDFITIYADIFSSRSLEDFNINCLPKRFCTIIPKKLFLAGILQIIKGFRPLISYDGITGEPQVSITYQTPQEKELTLRGLFDFFERQDKRVMLAIDEFQTNHRVSREKCRSIYYELIFNNLIM